MAYIRRALTVGL